MEKGVSGSVSNTTAPVSLTALAKLVGLTTKGSLVDLSFSGTGEGHAVVFQLDDSGRGFAGLNV